MGVGSIATDIDDHRQFTIWVGQRFLVDKMRDGPIEVNTVDEDIGFQKLAFTPSHLTGEGFDAHSIISMNGPPLAVSAISHFKTFSVEIPIFRHKSTAPFPHLPRAPITSTLGSLPLFLTIHNSLVSNLSRGQTKTKGTSTYRPQQQAP